MLKIYGLKDDETKMKYILKMVNGVLIKAVFKKSNIDMPAGKLNLEEYKFTDS